MLRLPSLRVTEPAPRLDPCDACSALRRLGSGEIDEHGLWGLVAQGGAPLVDDVPGDAGGPTRDCATARTR